MSENALISLQGIGNTVMSLFAFAGAGMRIEDFLVITPDNGSQQIADIFGFQSEQVFLWRETQSALHNFARIGVRLARKKPGKVYLAYPVFKREGAIGLITGAEMVLDRPAFRFFNSKRLEIQIKPPLLHDIDANYSLYKSGGLDVKGTKSIFRRLILKASENFGEKFLLDRKIKKELLVCVHPGSKGERKRWPSEKYVKLIKSLLARSPGLKFLIIGGRDEAALVNEVAVNSGDAAIPLSYLSLAQTASVISECSIFLGNDSAPMHLAALQGTKTVALWGPSSLDRTSPYGQDCLAIASVDSDVRSIEVDMVCGLMMDLVLSSQNSAVFTHCRCGIPKKILYHGCKVYTC